MTLESALSRYFLDVRESIPSDLVELVQLDQQQCWESGNSRYVEEYVARFPSLSEDREALLDMLYNEYLLRKEIEPQLATEEFTSRFPDLAKEFLRQVALHDAFDEVPMDVNPSVELHASTRSPAQSADCYDGILCR